MPKIFSSILVSTILIFSFSSCKVSFSGALKANLEMLSKTDKTIDEIISGVTTPGGITEILNKSLNSKNALDAWRSGLDDLIRKN